MDAKSQLNVHDPFTMHILRYRPLLIQPEDPLFTIQLSSQHIRGLKIHILDFQIRIIIKELLYLGKQLLRVLRPPVLLDRVLHFLTSLHFLLLHLITTELKEIGTDQEVYNQLNLLNGLVLLNL